MRRWNKETPMTENETALIRALEEALVDWENSWDGEDDSIPGWVIHAQQVMKEVIKSRHE